MFALSLADEHVSKWRSPFRLVRTAQKTYSSRSYVNRCQPACSRHCPIRKENVWIGRCASTWLVFKLYGCSLARSEWMWLEIGSANSRALFCHVFGSQSALTVTMLYKVTVAFYLRGGVRSVVSCGVPPAREHNATWVFLRSLNVGGGEMDLKNILKNIGKI